MKRYEKYKDSGIEWIGKIPEHWEVKKLKYLANANPSNIDKKSKDDEYEIFLCNYVDGYKNDFISNELDFMKATANKNQIEKFLLNKGDVIATKDSETSDDIANPALVVEDFENVVCGYHLTHIKPKGIYGEYLFRQFQSTFLQAYFEVSANGVTRYGLGVDKFNSVLILVPHSDEQTAIANYLDRKTAEINDLITKKEQLLTLYEEEKTAIINQAVTKGINPDVKMKDSGIDWLGGIPEHWEVKPLTKYLESIADYRGRTPTKKDTGVFLVTARNIKNGRINYELSQEYVDFDDVQSLLDRGRPAIGDVLFTTEAPLGEVANIDREDIALAQRIIKFRGKENFLNNFYLKYWLMSDTFQQDLHTYATGSTALGIKASKLTKLLLVLPPYDEQSFLVTYIEKETARIDEKIEKTKKLIALQKEYCTALISEVVTGKIKVTGESKS